MEILTVEDLKKDTSLANVDEGVLKAAATYATNFFGSVIKSKQGEAYSNVDAAVKEVLGVDKPAGVSTSQFVKNQISDFKAKAEAAANLPTLQTERDALKSEVATLKKQILEGKGDETMKAQLAKLTADLTQAQADLNAAKKHSETSVGEWKSKYEQEAKTNLELAYNSEAEKYLSGLKFKPAYDESVVGMVKETIKREVMAKGTPAFETVNGTRQLVFKDANGAVLNNATNGLKPFTFADFAGEIAKKHIVEGSGGGGGTKGSKGGGSVAADLGGAKTKPEAMEAIKKMIASEGIAITDPNYQTRMDELWESAKDLPLK